MYHHSFFRNLPILYTSINIVLLSHDILKLTIKIFSGYNGDELLPG